MSARDDMIVAGQAIHPAHWQDEEADVHHPGVSILKVKETVRNPKFHKFIESMRTMHEKKNNDYAHDGNPYSNFEEAAAFAGVTVDQVFAVLIGIKEARLRELTASGKTPNNESIQDTRLDAAVYTALRASYHQE